MALLSNGLLPASFRGALFAVTADEVGGGRRIALHQYPGRDEPWAEDMGRAPRTYRFRGFICDGDVVFFGGPIQLQRLLLLAALEKEGSGTLTHPTLGILNVSVARFSLGQDLGAGRMSAVDVEFVESGKQSFPSLLTSSSGILSVANVAKLTIAVDAVRAIATVARVVTARRDVGITAATWSAEVAGQRDDATALARLASQLPGGGRFSAGGNAGIEARTSTDASVTIVDLVESASAAREAISGAAAGLGVVMAGLDLRQADALPDAVFTLVDALAVACADPADALRILARLAGFTVDRSEGATPAGLAIQLLFRRAIAVALVSAAARYQPTSNDDAALVITGVSGLIDTIATEAADVGDNATFGALRSARAAIVEDLRTRGAPLPRVTIFAVPLPQPALVLAQRFYRDPTRADQLVTQARPRHPLFMPTAIRALAA